jgi:TRAP transporter TAXI family solute receptor
LKPSLARTAVAVGVLVAAMAGTAACGGQRKNDTKDTGAGGDISCEITSDTRIGVATGNTTGVYYPLGNALAEQVSSATGGKLRVTAAETGASVQNIEQLMEDRYQVAFSLFDTATDAFNGKGSFKTPQKVQALARIYDNYTQVVVRADAGINSVADLKGKRVSTGSPKSGTEVIANRVITAAGLNPETDIQPQRLDLTKTVDGMKGGTIDAMFFSGGLPTPGITDLITTAGGKVKFIDITSVLGKMAELNPAYQKADIPAEIYKTPAAVPTIVVPNVLLVREDLDPNVACVLTKTLFDKKDALVKANAAAKGISLDTAKKTQPVALHRGAEKALGDLGAK